MVVTAKKNACTRIMSGKIFMQALTSQSKKNLQGNEANLHNMLQWLELTVSSNVTLLIPQIPSNFSYKIIS